MTALASKAEWKVPSIMATVGPTLEKFEDLRRAIDSGAHWFRFPCGYRQRPHLQNARDVRAAAVAAGIPVPLLLDLPSSRPRTGAMQCAYPRVMRSFSGIRKEPRIAPVRTGRLPCRCPA